VVKAAIYMRVSTGAQNSENQRASCVALCRQNGWDPVIIDETASGARVRRPGWDEVMRLAIGREVAGVVVWAIDRIGRSLQEVFDCINAIDQSGVRLLSVKEPWIDAGAHPGGVADLMRRLQIMIFAWAADFERLRLLERSREGTDRARREGRFGGRPRSALVGDGLALAVDLHRKGLSTVKIQRALFERGYFRPTKLVGKDGKPLRPQPLPRSTIHYAIKRLTTFDGLIPERPRKVASSA
jgi:DNA invertase Pin-like site-specific DNA recombinase